jgi:hypothetical protein
MASPNRKFALLSRNCSIDTNKSENQIQEIESLKKNVSEYHAKIKITTNLIENEFEKK